MALGTKGGTGGASSLFVGALAVACSVMLGVPAAGGAARRAPVEGLAARAPGVDLGESRARDVSFVVLLHAPLRPDCLVAHAASAGLSVHWTVGQRWAAVDGPVRAVERDFDVAVHDYRTPSGRVVYAATGPAHVPAGTCGEVAGVGAIRSYTSPTREDVPANGLTTTELVQAYDIAPLQAAGMNGQGQTVVFFESDGYRASDLGAFAQSQHLPVFNVQDVGQNPGRGDETPMDLETVHEIAPDATLVYDDIASGRVARTGSVATVLATALATVGTRWPGAAVSISLGFCETGGDFNESDVKAINAAVATLETKGSTVFASSGDSGGLDCTPPNDGGKPPRSSFVGVVVPAALPNVTGVGGTSLSTTSGGDWVGETTWSEPLLSQGAGGGVSQAFPRPKWQTGVGTGGQLDRGHGRQVPDVAADADPATGNLILVDGHSRLGGGTSLATPIWAASTVLIDQYLRAAGHPAVGFFNPTLYDLANGTPPFAPFHDITTGGNDVAAATPGYDMVTGLGSPDVWHIAQDLAGGGT
jgi:kumamolisin